MELSVTEMGKAVVGPVRHLGREVWYAVGPMRLELREILEDKDVFVSHWQVHLSCPT